MRTERHPAAPATVAAVAAAEVADAADNAALGHAVAANRGTNLDDLVQTILDRLDGQDARTTEWMDALVAAQVAAQAQIERLRRRRRDSQHRDDQEGLPSPRTLAAERSENQRLRPASIIIGSVDEHPREGLPHGHTLPSNRSLQNQPAESSDPTRDLELERMDTILKEMSSKMHRATSSAPELEKVKLIPYNGLTDPKPFLKSLSIAINRAHFSAVERDAGSCQLFVENLIEDALSWFSRLEANTIDSYHQLTSVFLQHHSIFMVKGASNADLWTSYESRFREDLVITQLATLEDALHRANRFIEVKEEKAAMAKRQPKASRSKDKSHDDHYEPHQHYDKDYAKSDKAKKAATYAIDGSDSQPSKPWNKYYRETDPKLQKDDHNRHNDRQRTEEPRLNERARDNDRRPEPPKRNRDGPWHDDNPPIPRNRIHMIMGGLTTCRDSVRSIKNYHRQAEVHHFRSTEHNVQPLPGFDGDTVMTVGTIMLPIYVGGMMHCFNFAVVDKPIVYNVILASAPPVPTIGPNVHPIIYSLNKLTASTCSAITQLLLPNNVSTNTPQADTTDSDWQTEIRNYIADGIVPTDKWAARRLRARSTQYTLFDGNLCRWNAAGVLLSCISGDATLQVMREIHEGAGGNHSGGRALVLRIRKHGHYWPTMISDCKKFVARCEKCQRHAPIVHAPTELLQTATPPYPFMRWTMDIVRPFPASRQKKYLLIMMDYFTKWAEAESYARIQSKFKGFCANWRIRLRKPTPRYPQGNGQAKATNKTIIDGLKNSLRHRSYLTIHDPSSKPRNEPLVTPNDRGSRRTKTGDAEQPRVTPNEPRVTPNEPRVALNDRGSRRTTAGHAERTAGHAERPRVTSNEPWVTPNKPRVTPNEPRVTPNDHGSRRTNQGLRRTNRGTRRTTAGHRERTAGHSERTAGHANEPRVTLFGQTAEPPFGRTAEPRFPSPTTVLAEPRFPSPTTVFLDEPRSFSRNRGPSRRTTDQARRTTVLLAEPRTKFAEPRTKFAEPRTKFA
ncbi:Retrotransposon gag domain [Arabidopsis thaliana x Arabidopsis arenosa]|uniref:Retrotransposon gag domain n=1 Tax=Arabidopsis thaliana x Arabidopsis arenosa TaxID=1240361 RepID=A0A8T1XHR2_9BRAS|nr:Retrotransposon gag domain [Arabidopsis thaliana x Arabidopsis arenosa]